MSVQRFEPTPSYQVTVIPSEEPEPLVLVVDDDQEVCELLSLVLRTEGYRVSCARDGVEAVQKACTLGPDAIVMDLCLPRLDGCSAIQQLKAHSPTRQIPMVALTGYGSFDGVDERAWLAGCDAFFSKPPELDRLVETLRTMVTATPGDDRRLG
jgi:CheY-like chemotaxis protein